MTRGVRAGTRLRILGATLRGFLREPVNVALLIVLPVVVVTGYGSLMGALPRLPSMTADPATLGAVNGALFVAAFLPGVIGLFQVISARRADERLTLAGASAAGLFGARVLTVAAASVLTAGVSLAVLDTRVSVSTPVPAAAVLVFVGLLYGLIGLLVGAVLPRELEGSLVLVFLADIDESLSSGLLGADTGLVELLPLSRPHDLFVTAVGGGAFDPGTAAGALVYGVVLFGLALGTYAVVGGGAPG